MNKFNTDEIITNDAHLIQSFADLNGLKQADARTVIVEAEGAYVTDSEGNKLIDGIGGLWCVNVGHGRREIIDAITEQLKTLDFYSTFYQSKNSLKSIKNLTLQKPPKISKTRPWSAKIFHFL